MITYYYQGVRHKHLKEIPARRVGSWVYVENPNEEELEKLERDLHVNKDLLRDALDPNEVPRVEVDEGTVYIFVQTPYRSDGSGMTTYPVLIVIGSDFVLTLSRVRVDFLEVFLKEKKKTTTTQRTKTLLRFWFALNESFTRHLARIGKELRSLSSDVEQIRVDDLVRFVSYEKTANDFLGALVPMRAMIHTILTERYLSFYEEDKDLVEDLVLGMGQLIETSRSTHRHVVNIRESSSVIMTHTLNRSIQTLTILTIVLSIPMILGSLYSMNIPLPLEGVAWMFWAIIGISLILMGAVFVLLLRR